MMPEPEVLKVQALVEAARQRLNLALNRDSWLQRQEHTVAADELLAEAQQVLRTRPA
jgi:hypothetical protein